MIMSVNPLIKEDLFEVMKEEEVLCIGSRGEYF